MAYTLLDTRDTLDQDDYPISAKEDSDKTHAKVVLNGTSIRYYVKKNKFNRLYNPIGNPNIKASRHNSRDTWVMKKVIKPVFDQYLEFLKTKNLAYLTNAERSIL